MSRLTSAPVFTIHGGVAGHSLWGIPRQPGRGRY
jgi:hypothetical protein